MAAKNPSLKLRGITAVLKKTFKEEGIYREGLAKKLADAIYEEACKGLENKRRSGPSGWEAWRKKNKQNSKKRTASSTDEERDQSDDSIPFLT